MRISKRLLFGLIAVFVFGVVVAFIVGLVTTGQEMPSGYLVAMSHRQRIVLALPGCDDVPEAQALLTEGWLPKLYDDRHRRIFCVHADGRIGMLSLGALSPETIYRSGKGYSAPRDLVLSEDGTRLLFCLDEGRESTSGLGHRRVPEWIVVSLELGTKNVAVIHRDAAVRCRARAWLSESSLLIETRRDVDTDEGVYEELDLATGKMTLRFSGNDLGFFCVSPDRQFLCMAVRRKREYLYRIYELPSLSLRNEVSCEDLPGQASTGHADFVGNELIAVERERMLGLRWSLGTYLLNIASGESQLLTAGQLNQVQWLPAGANWWDVDMKRVPPGN